MSNIGINILSSEWANYTKTRDYFETEVRHSKPGKPTSETAAADKVMLFH